MALSHAFGSEQRHLAIGQVNKRVVVAEGARVKLPTITMPPPVEGWAALFR
jgi:hypothetical protein